MVERATRTNAPLLRQSLTRVHQDSNAQPPPKSSPRVRCFENSPISYIATKSSSFLAPPTLSSDQNSCSPATTTAFCPRCYQPAANPPRSTAAMTAHEPTETSPLLQAQRTPDGLQVLPPQPVDDDYDENAVQQPEDGGDLERQESNVSESGLSKYKGLPEVKKQMKYILPAVAVGVSN